MSTETNAAAALTPELLALEAVLIRVLANLAAANDNSGAAIGHAFSEAADILERRALENHKSENNVDIHAMRIVEELRVCTLGKQKLRRIV